MELRSPTQPCPPCFANSYTNSSSLQVPRKAVEFSELGNYDAAILCTVK